MAKALIVGIDGTDGCGKTTLVNGLIDNYTKKGLKITFLHFPRYNTELGKVIKKVLLKELNFHPSAFQMMCSADRVNWSTYERPAMEEGYDIILVDRFTSSAIVYGQIEGLDPTEVQFNDRLIAPLDMNILLLVDPQISMQRMSGRDEAATKYENIEAMTKALKLYKELPSLIDNVYFVDASQSIEDVREIVTFLIDQRLE